MRRIKFAVATALALMSAPAIAATRSIVIVLPSDYAGPAADLKLEINRVLGGQSPGSSVTIINGLTHTTIARIALPNEARYANPNVKARFQNAGARAVSQYIDALATTHPAPAALPSQVAPVSINAIAADFLPPADDREILVVGSARNEDAREPKFSMRNAFPGDGLITASEDKSPYGTATRRDSLTGVGVHYCTTERPADWASPLIAARTERFWSLFVEGMGGKLSTFTPDLSACFDRLIDGRTAPARHYEIDKSDTRLQMLTVERERAEINTVPQPVAPGATTRDARHATSSGQPSRAAQAPGAGLVPLGRKVARAAPAGPASLGLKKNPCRTISVTPRPAPKQPNWIEALFGPKHSRPVAYYDADPARNYSARGESPRSTVTPSITRRVSHALGEQPGGKEHVCLN